MKSQNTLILLFSLFLLAHSGLSQCNQYFQFEEGKSWAYETYDGKGKLQGKQTQKVTKYSSSSTGFEATVAVQSLDKKGKELADGELEISCDGGVVKFDMRKFIQKEQVEALEAYDVEVVAEDLEYPSDLAAGTQLKDGIITITASGAPIKMEMQVRIVDRVVEKKETVITAAGTFDCWKIKGKTKIENQMGMNMKFEYDLVEWITEGVGLVRSESYDKGKLKSYTVVAEVN